MDNKSQSTETIDLSQFDDDFNLLKAEKREFEPVPDGNYKVVVERVELTRSRKTNNPLLKWTLQILGPQCEGRLLWRNNMLQTRENLQWLKNDLYVCDLILEKVSDLPANLHKLLDIELEVSKRTKGERENVYFNRRILVETGPTPRSTAGGPKNDLIPF